MSLLWLALMLLSVGGLAAGVFLIRSNHKKSDAKTDGFVPQVVHTFDEPICEEYEMVPEDNVPELPNRLSLVSISIATEKFFKEVRSP